MGLGLSALLLGRSSVSKQGIFVLPGVIDADFTGTISIMVKVFVPPVTIMAGTRIAQLVPFRASVPCVRDAERGGGGFGSTDTPFVAFTEIIGSAKPVRQFNLYGPLGKSLLGKRMLLDTGSDVTIVPKEEWFEGWELQNVNTVVTGIGGQSSTQISVNFITIEDCEDKRTAHVRPYVLNTTVWLLGRDALAQWGVRLTTHF